MHINIETFKLLMRKQGLTQVELARRSRLGIKTVGRIAKGEELRASNGEKIAKALGVTVAELTIPPSKGLASGAATKGGKERLVIDLEAGALNDLWVASHHYGVEPRTVLELAPLLFSLVAERSLTMRRKSADDWKGKMDDLMAAAANAMSDDLGMISSSAEDAYGAELESIENRDLSGGYRSWYSTQTYTESVPHPFFAEIEGLAADSDLEFIESKIGSVTYFYGAFHEALKEIIPDDHDYAELAREAVGKGHVLLRDLPAELMAGDKSDDRVKWLASRYGDAAGDLGKAVAVNKQEYEDLLADFDLASGDSEDA